MYDAFIATLMRVSMGCPFGETIDWSIDGGLSKSWFLFWVACPLGAGLHTTNTKGNTIVMTYHTNSVFKLYCADKLFVCV